MDWLIDHLAVIMFAAMFVVIFCGYPVAFVLGGLAFVFAVIGWYFGVFRLPTLLNVVLRVWGGVAADPVLVSLPMFIFMGTLFERSGTANDMLHCLQVLLRRVPGGLGLAVMTMGTILAAPIGVVGASVVLLTLISLPLMLERNYDKQLAVGIIASAGTLGVLIPPSVMLVVMSELLTTSLATLFAAATIPGFLLSGLFLIYIYVVAILRPDKAPKMPDEAGPQSSGELLRMLSRGLFPATFLMAVVLGSIFAGWATATEASGVGCLGALLLAWWNGRLDRPTLHSAITDAAITNGMVFMIFIGATGFSFVFRGLGGDEVVVEILKSVGIDSRWEILSFIMVLVFLLGFPFEWIEICLIVLPVFLPILAPLDFSDYLGPGPAFLPWLAILIAVNLQTSFMTAPFGATLFYMKGTVPPSVTMNDIYKGMTPFVILQVVGLALCVAFPELVLWLPRVAGLLD